MTVQAVTVSMLITRKISIVRAILYIISQCLGAIAGAGILAGRFVVGLDYIELVNSSAMYR